MTEDSQKEGIVYVLVNESMPGLVKVGVTRNLPQRLQALFRTNVPLPFTLHYAVHINHPREIEQAIWEVFAPHRINNKREFLEIPAERVVAMLQTYLRQRKAKEVDESHIVGNGQNDESDDTSEPTGITDEDRAASEKRTQKRSAFNFFQEGIPLGATLDFFRDPNITAEVISADKIRYKGKETSMSEAARDILGFNYGVRGPSFWKYEDELLVERRERRERENYKDEDDEQNDESDGISELTGIAHDNRKSSQRRTQRRSSFNFIQEGIPIGAELTFSKNREITAKVTGARQILYDGKECSLSDAAGRILIEQFGRTSTRIAGTEFWEYQGETLSERRKRRERENHEDEDV